MNSYYTYIIFSKSKNKFYVGSTNNISRRLAEHNSGHTKSTKFGIPWELIFIREFSSKAEAVNYEIKIKKRGISRFLSDLKG